jgi:hypothetical protein
MVPIKGCSDRNNIRLSLGTRATLAYSATLAHILNKVGR